MASLSIEELRQKHPTFTYKSYGISRENNDLLITHHFVIEPDIEFHTKLIIPNAPDNLESNYLYNFAFQLGLVEMISYWKATCSPQIIIEAGALRLSQIEWWKSVLLHGLGEFFYRNNIDFSQPDFLTMTSNRSDFYSIPEVQSENTGNLILVSGGKDSSVMLETLKPSPQSDQLLLVNPTQAALDQTQIAGFTSPIIIKRNIDPKLIELNSLGYLNGHTPFSAYLAFVGVLVASLYKKKYVVVANEKSASESNVSFHGMEINHQYSKSYAFESRFRSYAKEYVSKESEYFSFIRPIFDLQVGQLFSKFSLFHQTFRSCNVGQKENKWCGTCPKCAFVYLTLFPFFSYEQVLGIFGSDFFTHQEIAQHLRGLVGLEKEKPFECVGTVDESKLAVQMCIEKYELEGQPLPPILVELQESIGIKNPAEFEQLKTKILKNWDTDHFLPEQFEQLLKLQLEMQ